MAPWRGSEGSASLKLTPAQLSLMMFHPLLITPMSWLCHPSLRSVRCGQTARVVGTSVRVYRRALTHVMCGSSPSWMIMDRSAHCELSGSSRSPEGRCLSFSPPFKPPIKNRMIRQLGGASDRSQHRVEWGASADIQGRYENINIYKIWNKKNDKI